MNAASEVESRIGSGIGVPIKCYVRVQTLKARFPMDVWVRGCLKRDLPDDLSKRVGAYMSHLISDLRFAG